MHVAEAISQLLGFGFMQIHKLYIVAQAHIDSIVCHQITIGQAQISVAGTNRYE